MPRRPHARMPAIGERRPTGPTAVCAWYLPSQRETASPPGRRVTVTNWRRDCAGAGRGSGGNQHGLGFGAEAAVEVAEGQEQEHIRREHDEPINADEKHEGQEPDRT